MNNRRQMYYSRYSGTRSVHNIGYEAAADKNCAPCAPVNPAREEMDCGCVDRTLYNKGYNKDCCQRDMEGFPLAMAYVPWQSFCNLRDEHEAFRDGTIFKDLDLDFYGRRCN